MPHVEVWRFVEFFAGEANVTSEIKLASYCGVSLDLAYGGKAMDLLTPPGMAFRSFNGDNFLFYKS